MFALYEPEIRGRRAERILVRQARPGDVTDIVALAGTRGPLPDTFEDSIRKRFGDPGACVLLAVVPENDAAGWAMVARWPEHDDCPEGFYVSALTVAPSCRRRGVGERLLGELMAWTAARSTALGSVINVRNQASIVLHEKLGFVEIARGAGFGGITFDGGLGLRLTAGPLDSTPGTAA